MGSRVSVKRWKDWIWSLALLVFFLCFAIRLVGTHSAFYHSYQKHHHIVEASGKDETWLQGANGGLTQFLRDGNEAHLTSFFNEKEILHMHDVYHVFQGILMLEIVSGLWILFVHPRWMHEKRKENHRILIQHWLHSMGGILVAFLVCVVSGILFFSTGFVAMHHLFFHNDLWLLNPDTDVMIRMMPLDFFIYLFLWISSIAIGAYLFVLGGGVFYYRKWKKDSNRTQ